MTGERVTWIETAHSTGGELLAADLYVRPAAAVGLAHRHVRQEERFAVGLGTAGFEVAGEARIVSQGDEVTIPIGVAHRWWNAGQDELRVRMASTFSCDIARAVSRVLLVLGVALTLNR